MKDKIKNLLVGGTYSLLSIVLGMMGLLTFLSVVLLVVGVFRGDAMPSWFGIPVSLELPSSEVKRIASVDYTVFPLHGELTIFHTTFLNSTLLNIIPLLITSTGLFLTYLLRMFFKNVYNGKFFDSENVKIMYTIGAVFIIIPPIVRMLKEAVLISLPKDLIVDGMKVIVPYSISFAEHFISEYLILGLFFLILADVFKEGRKLKEENDKTV